MSTTQDRAREGLRLMVYDQTCRGPWYGPGLTHAWWTGGQLYSVLGRFDAWHGVRTWDEAFAWLERVSREQPIAELQYWGHGKWGEARVARQIFGIDALAGGDPLSDGVRSIAGRFLPGDRGLWWFRTCETFGARPGHRFAQALAETIGCRVAGHTFIIGHVQSGLHSLLPGAAPHWSVDEGLAAGDPERPKRAHWSHLRAPNTITCLRGSIPNSY